MPKQDKAASADDVVRFKTVYNVSPYPLPPSHDRVAVMPGEGVRLPVQRATELLDFPAEWSEENPRAVPSRPAKAQPEPEPPDPDTSIPAESGDPQENPE